MSAKPERHRLVSSEIKVARVKFAKCSNCLLLRRFDGTLEDLYTPQMKLNALHLWPIKDTFSLSTNILICKSEALDFDNFYDDVNWLPEPINNSIFIDDNQIETFNFNEYNFKKRNGLILKMVTSEIEALVGTFDAIDGKGNSRTFGYKVEVHFVPLIFNVFHMQIEVYQNINGDYQKVNRDKANSNNLRSLSGEIKNRIIQDDLIGLYKP